MVTRTRWAVLVAAALLLTTVSLPASAATPAAPNRFVSGWVPYWQATSGGATVTGAGTTGYMSDVSLFGSSTALTTLAANAHSKGLPVFQTLFSSSIAGFMTEAVRISTVNAIVNGVVAGNYDGVDIDYEFVWSVSRNAWGTITPEWVKFVSKLSTALHLRGKLLSVTVPPVWNAGANGYTVYAQPQIAPWVDRLRLMVYDWSISNPGPIAPDYWVKSVVAYSTVTAKVPPKKLQLGVPAYGRHWTTKKVSSQVCPDGALKKVKSITMREAEPLRAAHSAVATRNFGEVTFGWDETVTGLTRLPPPYVPNARGITVDGGSATGQAPAVRLGVPRQVTCTVRHTVYVPDATTITTNAKVALASGWSGITMWTFGYETADVYDATHLGGIAAQRAPGAPALVLSPVTRTTNTVTVTGTAYNPTFDLPVPVQVTFLDVNKATVGSATNSLANGPVSATSAPAPIGPFHGFSRVATIPAGATSVCVTQLAWGGTPIAATRRCATLPPA